MENKKINELLDESRPWDRELLNIVTKRNKYTKMYYALEEMRKI